MSARSVPAGPAPDPIAPLLAPLAGLPGVLKPAATLLAKACGGGAVLDLLLHLPERVVDRPVLAGLDAAVPDMVATVAVTVAGVDPPRGGAQPWSVRARAADAPIELKFFQRARWLPGWLGRHFPDGAARVVSGRLRPFQGRWTMDRVDYVSPPETIPRFEAVWPLVGGLHRPQLARAMHGALAALPDLPEWLDPPLLARRRWPGFAEALRRVQAPVAAADAEARARLGYDELFAGQLAMAIVRREVLRRPGRRLPGTGRLQARALAAFGHAPTPGQAAALEGIGADLTAPTRMLRLLQGDVGSGKTLVALLAMLQVVESGAQAAIMAPTEILARQHLRTFARLCGAAGVEAALLTGSVKGAERRRVLGGLADGTITVAVGTHALFQEAVAFRDLGLAVVDEQHRFGVAQRLALTAKGDAPDLLVMTATPIPRTLLLTRWGKMAVSRLEGKPAGRRPIETRVLSQARREAVLDRLVPALARGERAYWVVRAVTGGDHDDSVAAEAFFAELRRDPRFAGRVGMAHGELPVAGREAAIAAFAAGDTALLVATTVVEVGVDVPEASIMIIEQAERFGLSALHQLRGRVGRGDRASACLLLHSADAPPGMLRRLGVLRDTEDGFVIAEADLRLRGGGDPLAERQAGLAGARLSDPGADPDAHGALVHLASRDAEALLARDPGLATPRGRAAGLLLRLFGHDPSLATLGAG